MGRKRYNPRQAGALLGRLADGAGAFAQMTATRARRDLRDLLLARLTDIEVIADRTNVDLADDDQLHKWYQRVGHIIGVGTKLRQLGIGQELMVSGVRLRVSATSARLEVQGATDAMLSFQALNLLKLAGEQLRSCQCGRVFIREGKRLYCSDRCQKRYYMRAKRAQERREGQ